MELFRSIFQSFQNCPKFENLNYEVLQCLTERFFRDNPYLASVIRNFNCNRYFRTVEWRIQGRGLWGRDPPQPLLLKKSKKNISGKTPTDQIPIFPVSLRYPNISRKFSPLITDSSGLWAHLLQNFLSYYQYLSEHIFSSFVPLVANHSFSRV